MVTMLQLCGAVGQDDAASHSTEGDEGGADRLLGGAARGVGGEAGVGVPELPHLGVCCVSGEEPLGVCCVSGEEALFQVYCNQFIAFQGKNLGVLLHFRGRTCGFYCISGEEPLGVLPNRSTSIR